MKGNNKLINGQIGKVTEKGASRRSWVQSASGKLRRQSISTWLYISIASSEPSVSLVRSGSVYFYMDETQELPPYCSQLAFICLSIINR